MSPSIPEVETLVWGHTGIEGPRADRAGNLYFSDLHRGGVYRRSTDGEVTTIVPKRRAIGGIALHVDGGLVISGRNLQHVRDGKIRILVDDPTVRTFNDLTVDPDGRIVSGSVRDRYLDGTPIGGPGMEPEHRRYPYGELHRVGPEGDEVLYEYDGLSNGLGFSPERTRVYHVLSGGIRVNDVNDEGKLVNLRMWALPPFGADGLALDESGCVWVAGGPGVSALDLDGDVVRTITLPTDRALSLCFGGPDGRDLYVTTMTNTDDPSRGGTIFRVRMEVPGLAVPLATV